MSLFTDLQKNLFLISGPCVLEDEDIVFKIAETLKNITTKLNIPYVFKASYLKANRTSIESYSGPGIDEGLKLLQKVKTDFDLPILTDIHESHEVKAVAEVADILQIPAFLARQTFLLKAAAETGKIVNIKKAQFMSAENMQEAISKVVAANNFNVMATERGTSFGYNNLVVDFRGFPIMKSMGYPVIYDATHSLQKPSVGKSSGGSPEYVPMMAKAAIATGCVDGLFIETHPEPASALSDSASMIELSSMENLLQDCLKVYKCIKK